MPDIYDMIGKFGSAAIQGASNLFGANWSNVQAAERERSARLQNFNLGEIAANNADARTRALYNDLYGVEAQLQQIKNAGLSPSMFYGDMSGISGQAGAQGTGAAGISPINFGIPPVDIAGIAKMNAEKDLLKAQKENVESDTEIKRLKADFEKMSNEKYKNEFTILNSCIQITGKDTSDNEDNEPFSLFEIADLAYDFDTFVKWSREHAEKNGMTDFIQASTTESGMTQLRAIYHSYNKFGHDLSVLSSEKINAEFQESITRLLNDSDFAELSKEQQISALRKDISVNKLEATQKNAWNNILKRLEKSNASSFDITVVCGMILAKLIEKI